MHCSDSEHALCHITPDTEHAHCHITPDTEHAHSHITPDIEHAHCHITPDIEHAHCHITPDIEHAHCHITPDIEHALCHITPDIEHAHVLYVTLHLTLSMLTVTLEALELGKELVDPGKSSDVKIQTQPNLQIQIQIHSFKKRPMDNTLLPEQK